MPSRKTILDVNDFEAAVKEQTRSVVVVSHNFSHLKRTAEGSEFLVETTGGDLQNRLIAYEGSLVHDFGRPNSEIIEHGDQCVEGARQFLKGWDCLGKEDEILRMVSNHNTVIEGPVYDRALFIADKALEAMGAYVAFRVCVYAAEIDDFKDRDMTELPQLTHDLMSNRMRKYNDSIFPEEVRPLVRKQSDWTWRFIEDLKDGKEWALNLASHCFSYGRSVREWDGNSPKPSFEDMIYQYIPILGDDLQYKQEAMRYLTEPLYHFCHNLVDSRNRTVFAPKWQDR